LGVFEPKDMLFEPGRMGPLQLPNRIVKSATRENRADADGRPTAATRRFYRRLARGGSGLILTGDAYVHPSGQSGPRQNGAHSVEALEGWRPITEDLHATGVKIALQLTHGGRQVKPRAGAKRDPVAPSAVPNFLYFTRPRAMRIQEIRRTIDDFATAAARARAVGFDAVQLHAAHGYLIAQFLSPLTNRRRDAWGGNSRRRFRFLAETYRAVRRAVGDDFAVLCKLNLDDFTVVGLTPRQSFRYARWLSQMGIDGLEISGGVYETGLMISRGQAPLEMLAYKRHRLLRTALRLVLAAQRPRFRFKENYFLPLAAAVKPSLTTPLILVGGIRRREAAERILKRGWADFISMARPLLREPDLPLRWRHGRQSRSRCIACNRCLGAMEQDRIVGCYAAGRPSASPLFASD
jgi:2,4-dienoyl-CoA reductase-like NADH-dependent reductase (Old Yellow Enzyme family)